MKICGTTLWRYVVGKMDMPTDAQLFKTKKAKREMVDRLRKLANTLEVDYKLK